MTPIGAAHRWLRVAASVAAPVARVTPVLPMVIVALLLSVAPGVQASQKKYSAFGLVLKINAPSEFVVSCKEIPGFMDAMVMAVGVRDPENLKTIRPGVLVDFTLVVDSDSSYADNIKIHRFESSDQRPLEVRMLEMIEGAFDAKPSAPQMLAVDQKVPDFTLVDQYRHPLNFSALSGKVVAISFVYTRCSFPEYCFRLSNNLGLVAKRFTDRLDNDLVLLTITFDPTNDGPEALSKYANMWKASAKRWYFLTGPPAEVKRVCLMFGMNFWPDMGMIVHSMHTAVIDRQGRLVANLEGNEFTADQLGNLLKTVMDRRP
ncbi:MAG: SCO family protein [Candidatus Acidiferrum sp.]|jgi:protein SCO1/2